MAPSHPGFLRASHEDQTSHEDPCPRLLISHSARTEDDQRASPAGRHLALLHRTRAARAHPTALMWGKQGVGSGQVYGPRYAEEPTITAVSSFWGNPPGTAFHALNIFNALNAPPPRAPRRTRRTRTARRRSFSASRSSCRRAARSSSCRSRSACARAPSRRSASRRRSTRSSTAGSTYTWCEQASWTKDSASHRKG